MAVEALCNDQVLAHSDETVVVEGNHYFPRADVDTSVLEKSATTSQCPWKGTAHYYTIDITPSISTVNAMRTLPGIIPIRNLEPNKCVIELRSGTGSRLSRTSVPRLTHRGQPDAMP